MGGKGVAVVLQMMSSLARHCPTGIGDRGLVLEIGTYWPMCGKTKLSAGAEDSKSSGAHTDNLAESSLGKLLLQGL